MLFRELSILVKSYSPGLLIFISEMLDTFVNFSPSNASMHNFIQLNYFEALTLLVPNDKRSVTFLLYNMRKITHGQRSMWLRLRLSSAKNLMTFQIISEKILLFIESTSYFQTLLDFQTKIWILEISTKI